MDVTQTITLSAVVVLGVVLWQAAPSPTGYINPEYTAKQARAANCDAIREHYKAAYKRNQRVNKISVWSDQVSQAARRTIYSDFNNTVKRMDNGNCWDK